jgi:hypothetical protein
VTNITVDRPNHVILMYGRDVLIPRQQSFCSSNSNGVDCTWMKNCGLNPVFKTNTGFGYEY